MKRTLLILVLALLAGFFGRDGWRYLTEESPLPAQTSAPQAPSPATDAPLSVSSSADTSAPVDPELPSPPPPRVISLSDTPVAEGETVITQGYYEPQRGQFIFHTFTPTLETDTTGQTIVRVKTGNFNVSLSGDYESRDFNDVTLQPNQIRQSTVITEGTTHELSIGAKVDPVTSMILMTATASSEPNNIGVPVED